jgi:enterochelin esterase-like enzyme
MPKDKEISLSNLTPTEFTIHETFPILLLQDGTHFCSFTLTKQNYEELKKESLKGLYFSELAQVRIKINKVRV